MVYNLSESGNRDHHNQNTHIEEDSMQVNNHAPLRKLFIHAINVLFLFVLIILAAPQSYGDTKTAQPSPESCRKFVQEFYTWYRSNDKTIQDALKKRASSFTPLLTQKLNIDEAASAANPGEVVGLDFDPFLNAQDIPDRCIVGKVTSKDNGYSVEVFEVFSGKKEAKPSVIPELEFKNGQWIFTNFVYPGDKGKSDNLLSVLKTLAADRAKYAKASTHPVR
jgi:hypothetical protein